MKSHSYCNLKVFSNLCIVCLYFHADFPKHIVAAEFSNHWLIESVVLLNKIHEHETNIPIKIVKNKLLILLAFMLILQKLFLGYPTIFLIVV